MLDRVPSAPCLPDQPGLQHAWTNLRGLAPALFLARAAQDSPGPLLVITQFSEQAERLRQELDFFSTGEDFPEVLTFPDWETLPYDNFSAHQDIISDRLYTLYRLPRLQQGVIVVSLSSLMYRLVPKSYIEGNSLVLQTGDQFDIDRMRQNLIAAGYQAVDSVYEHGEFAVRGAIMDIYPMGSPLPYRIDLFDDEVETLRTFDPESQRSIASVNSINLLPAKEFSLDETGVQAFRRKFSERFDVETRSCPIYQDVSQGLASPGLEYYLPLFFETLDTLFDYLPADATIVKYGDISATGQQFWTDINSRYEDRQIDKYRPILKPVEVFLPVDEVFALLRRYPQVDLREQDQGQQRPGDFRAPVANIPDVNVDSKSLHPMEKLLQLREAHPDLHILICAESAGRRETILELMNNSGMMPSQVNSWPDFISNFPPLALTVAALDQGVWITATNLIILSEAQLFGGKIVQRRRRGQAEDATEFIFKSLSELHTGDAVVHIEHGVGRYRGLQTLSIDGQDTEFLVLEYAKETKLYVPVSSLHLISRYSGTDPDLAPLNQLGTDTWNKSKRAAAAKIRDVAAELLEIYARREAKTGYRYNCEDISLQQFADQFPFEETQDQCNAIDAVVNDMASDQAMDRLICGDVGFGKTEVAMRAAFIATQNSKQVAILVPTTLLAEQHFSSFSDRFAEWPITIDVISRFKSTREQQEILERMAAGKTDILIGTHKLLNGRIKYQNLGLLIIDEEHRFGVRQKEKLKVLRANVDVLTLTATPIPRTLNMALSGVRDLSLIVTPPAKRLSVKTFIREAQDSLIREAVLRELLRGGQVFYLHNEVKSIQNAADHLLEIIPQARLVVAHGQMPERTLEKVMADFYHKRYNVLVCTSIIETGIDIPSANTIIIHRADKFGLAQLHQLRGRVGRSHHQAYAYLLTPNQGRMSDDAHKRIDAIKAASALGAGFTLASHDLEIRGAGEFLGEDQSGHMQKIGFTLYLEMLDDAVKSIKAGKTPALELENEKTIDINLRIPALIPEHYLPDVHTRLVMYKRIAGADSEQQLQDLQEEMIDRFGILPEEAKLLFQATRLKLKAATYGVKKIDVNVSTGRVEFGPSTPVDPMSIVEMMQHEPQRYKLTSANQLMFHHDCEHDPRKKLAFVDKLLQTLRVSKQQAA